MFYSRCFLSLLVFRFNWQTNKTYYLQSSHKHRAWGGHAATVNEGLIMQSSLQDLALGSKETIQPWPRTPNLARLAVLSEGDAP